MGVSDLLIIILLYFYLPFIYPFLIAAYRASEAVNNDVT